MCSFLLEALQDGGRSPAPESPSPWCLPRERREAAHGAPGRGAAGCGAEVWEWDSLTPCCTPLSRLLACLTVSIVLKSGRSKGKGKEKRPRGHCKDKLLPLLGGGEIGTVSIVDKNVCNGTNPPPTPPPPTQMKKRTTASQKRRKKKKGGVGGVGPDHSNPRNCCRALEK